MPPLDLPTLLHLALAPAAALLLFAAARAARTAARAVDAETARLQAALGRRR